MNTIHWIDTLCFHWKEKFEASENKKKICNFFFHPISLCNHKNGAEEKWRKKSFFFSIVHKWENFARAFECKVCCVCSNILCSVSCNAASANITAIYLHSVFAIEQWNDFRLEQKWAISFCDATWISPIAMLFSTFSLFLLLFA